MILTGGSAVKNNQWINCDNPIRDPWGYTTEEQENLNRLLGTYLLAKGMVNGLYGYFYFQEYLVIQTKRYYKQPLQKGIVVGSIIKLLTDFPNSYFAIPLRISHERKKEIKDLVLLTLNHVAVTNPNRFIFT